ncbi:MAG: hypothetical protein ACJAYU_002225 [Bradymonadia bacterium]|jgi:hypothetical protein
MFRLEELQGTATLRALNGDLMKNLCLLIAALSVTACSSDPAPLLADTSNDASQTDTGESDLDAEDAEADASTGTIGENQSVVAHDEAHIFWTGWDEGQNARNVDVAVTFPPAEELYGGITMNFALSCPSGQCDPWDRYGSYGLVSNPGAEDEGYIELSRFITPFGVGASWQVDVTDLRPLLTDDVTLRAFVDTWVGPGSGFGNGWQVDVSFDFIGAEPTVNVIGVYPIWNLNRVIYGDPARPVAEQLPVEMVELPEGTTRALLRTFVTGHGQGNQDNCAEFCPADHTFTVGGIDHTETVWRDDCETTAAPNQQGTWQFPRAGWCPGAVAHDWTIDLGEVGPGPLEVGYDVSDYENLCRPDSTNCSGCALGNGCDWNDSNHTEPNFQLSAMVIAIAE